MEKERIAQLIWGIPLTKITNKDLVNCLIEWSQSSKERSCPRYVSTINVDFFVNALGWGWWQVRHPELLHVLRNSDIATADGMPVVWLSRLLGGGLHERIAGADLVMDLAKALSKCHGSLFLLGGAKETVELAASRLKSYYPQLTIAGAESSVIDIDGEALAGAYDRDLLLVEQINQAAPDILLLNLGNPKQEIWFHRVKHKLQVPVVIGVGGTFSFVAGTVARAPKWMQRFGLEWCYRLYQEPGRLGKRYLLDIIKAPVMAFPLLIYHNTARFWYALRYAKKIVRLRRSRLYTSEKNTLVAIPLPKKLDKSYAEDFMDHIDQFFDHDALLLDFKDVRFVDLEGFALLAEIFRRANQGGNTIYAMMISASIRRLMKVHRIWDQIGPHHFNTAKNLIAHFTAEQHYDTLFESVYQEQGYSIISFFGRLDCTQDLETLFKHFFPPLGYRDCIVDLRYCTYLDNLGLMFLLRAQKELKVNGKRFVLCRVNADMRRFLVLARAESLFSIYSDLEDVLYSVY